MKDEPPRPAGPDDRGFQWGRWAVATLVALAVARIAISAPAGEDPAFEAAMRALEAGRPDVTRAAAARLARRYDLDGRVDARVRMSGGRKPVPVGPTARTAPGGGWAALDRMEAAAIRARGLFPYPPLPHPLAPDGGGMVFPPSQLASHPELDRLDVAFDLPDAYLPEFPPPLFLTTHPDRGDVSRGVELGLQNYVTLLGGILTPLQLDGLRLLLTPFPQAQFNQTADRVVRSALNAVSCFSCHVNGHTTGQFHLVADVRPQADRPRIDTTSLRGVFAQRTFGSKRNLRSLEDFTEVENNTAYFDGDDASAQRKGARHFHRAELAAMAAFQNIIAFPPAPKLGLTGDLDPALATPAERRGEALFRGKARCVACHPGAYFTDNLSHDLKVERFVAGRAEGIFKTATLRGLKDSPPYLHDGRLPTLEDSVEFFNLVLALRLDPSEKAALAAYLRVL